MGYALNLDAVTGRILSATFPEYASPDMTVVETLPEGDISDYLYQSGEYVYDPLPEPEPVPGPQEERLTDIEAMVFDNYINILLLQ